MIMSMRELIKATVLSFIIVTAILAVSAFAVSWFVEPEEPQIQTSQSYLPKQIDSVLLFNLVNEYRISTNKTPFIWSEELCVYTDVRLKETTKEWSHTNFSAEGICMDCLLGENLARNFDSEQETLNAWLASPTHKENIDHPYQYSCIRNNQTNIVQLFVKYEKTK